MRADSSDKARPIKLIKMPGWTRFEALITVATWSAPVGRTPQKGLKALVARLPAARTPPLLGGEKVVAYKEAIVRDILLDCEGVVA